MAYPGSYLLLLFTALAAEWDVCCRRIPARLLAVFFLTGPLLRPGWYYYRDAGLFLLILFPLYYLHFFGAGDVKLTAVLAGWLGIPAVFDRLLCILAAAGLLSLAAVLRSRLRPVCHEKKPLTIPFAAAVCAGCWFSFFFFPV